jgi:hypothetical protein
MARPAKKRKLNCWEYKQCGRGPNGSRAPDREPCPAALETAADGVNGGHNGGRVCWAIAGTLCHGRQVGTYAVKLETCMACDFCRLVLREEKMSSCHRPTALKKRP